MRVLYPSYTYRSLHNIQRPEPPGIGKYPMQGQQANASHICGQLPAWTGAPIVPRHMREWRARLEEAQQLESEFSLSMTMERIWDTYLLEDHLGELAKQLDQGVTNEYLSVIFRPIPPTIHSLL